MHYWYGGYGRVGKSGEYATMTLLRSTLDLAFICRDERGGGGEVERGASLGGGGGEPW